MLLAHEITEEHKEHYIELLYQGHKRNTAAREIGTTSTQFNHLRSPKSSYYDEWFAEACLEAERSEEHRKNREEKLRAMIDERSEQSDAILIKRALIELPEWEPLRHQNFRHEITGTIAHKLLRHVSDEELERAIEKAEAERDIDRSDIRLLPPVAEE